MENYYNLKYAETIDMFLEEKEVENVQDEECPFKDFHIGRSAQGLLLKACDVCKSPHILTIYPPENNGLIIHYECEENETVAFKSDKSCSVLHKGSGTIHLKETVEFLSLIIKPADNTENDSRVRYTSILIKDFILIRETLNF